ncbi:MAG: helix-turn-helix domain-containing protein, partial [Acidimicrobiales bacterium]
VAPAPEESELLRTIDHYRPRPTADRAMAKLVAPDGQEFPLPASMYEVLRQAAHQLAAGLAVSIVPVGTRLSTQQAAELLGVSRPHVVKLLDQGEMSHTKVGRHRRVLLSDVLAYRDRQAARRSEALDELARLSEDLPLV